MAQVDYAGTYQDRIRELIAQHPRKEAMSLAVGGEWEAFGILSREIVVAAGLRAEHYLIDVGCGSGRLAHTLDVARYLGTDVVPDLIAYCREVCARPNWRFEVVNEIAIPEEAGLADMVSFFSVFTHLLHEDSYRYLLEARRVLKPGGKVVFSFWEFLPASWIIFEHMVKLKTEGIAKIHDQFVGLDAIFAWATHAGFEIEAMYPGNVPHIRVPYPLIRENGEVLTGMTSLGQSVCVLKKPVS